MKISTLHAMNHLVVALAVASLFALGCSTQAPAGAGLGVAPSMSSTISAPTGGEDGAGGSASTSTSGPEKKAPGVSYLLPISPPEIAAEGDPCGSCGELLAGSATAACSPTSLDLLNALMSCACGWGGACDVACSATVAPNQCLEANACEGAEPNYTCKTCLVAASTDTPAGCGEAWAACLADLPPAEPFACSTSYPDAPSCGLGYMTPPACDEVITVNCTSRGDLLCDVGFEWVKCCTTDDTAPLGDICLLTP